MAEKKLVLVSNVFFHNDEKPFRSLRSFLKALDTAEVQEFDQFDYNVETDKIEVTHCIQLQLDYKAFQPALIREKLQSGYIQLTIGDLLKICNV